MTAQPTPSDCPAWCDDHMHDADLDYHQSTERRVGQRGLILVGPGGGTAVGEDDGGIYVLPNFGGPFPSNPALRDEAERLLEDWRTAARVAAVQAEELAAAIKEVWG